jgi:HEPN domain-containing protein
MQPDPRQVAETKAWLDKAVLDLRAAKHERTASPPLTGDMVFHAQQLVEKTLKAFLSWHDQPFRKTHSLVELGRQCAVIQPDLEALLREAAPLTEYAWKFRYPGEAEEPALEEADAALAMASRVFRTILAFLPEAVKPCSNDMK